MRRRPAFLVAVALPISIAAGAAVFAPGCGPSDQLDDVCGFLKDPDNCYRGLFDEVRTRCGDTFDDLAAADVKKSGPWGTFLSAEALDLCVLRDVETNEVRGQILIDSSPTLDQFPLKTISFERRDARSEVCGKISATSEFNFGVTINACNEDPADTVPVCKDAFDGSGSLSGEGRNPDEVVGGTFSVTPEEGRDIYITTCPSGDSFRFNRFETVKCDGYEQLTPRTEIDSNPSRIIPPWEANTESYEGWLRFRVHYPPYEGELANAAPVTIQYFNCVIPPRDPCADGIKDFYETDVDCGGPISGTPASQPDAPPAVRGCERCEAGQICESASDCKSGICLDNPATGFKECTDPEEGEGGAGGGSGGAGGGSGGAGGA